MTMRQLSRRAFLKTTVAGAAVAGVPRPLRAQSKTFKIGAIHPVTGPLAEPGQACRLGAQLADPKYDPKKRKPKTLITEAKIEAFEKLIDAWEGNLRPLKNFILPAGSKGAAMLHLARCVGRRAERKVVGLATATKIPPIVVVYLNRLSDLLFVMARVENRASKDEEVDW